MNIDLPGSWFHMRSFRRCLISLTVFCSCILLSSALCPEAAGQLSGTPDTQSAPIQITADRLVSRVKDNYAEFIGNVVAVQGDFEIRSDRLRIHYRRNAGQAVVDAAGSDAIEKIVASGRVRIKSGSRQAQTETAEYLVDEGLLVMKGENSTVVDGENSLRGSVIRLNRLDGKISVEGGPSERVRAVFQSTGRQPTGGDSKDKQNKTIDSSTP